MVVVCCCETYYKAFCFRVNYRLSAIVDPYSTDSEVLKNLRDTLTGDRLANQGAETVIRDTENNDMLRRVRIVRATLERCRDARTIQIVLIVRCEKSTGRTVLFDVSNLHETEGQIARQFLEIRCHFVAPLPLMMSVL